MLWLNNAGADKSESIFDKISAEFYPLAGCLLKAKNFKGRVQRFVLRFRLKLVALGVVKVQNIGHD